MCPSGATSLSAECCFGELTHIEITTGCVDPVQSGHNITIVIVIITRHQNVIGSLRDILVAKKLLIWWQTIITYLLIFIDRSAFMKYR